MIGPSVQIKNKKAKYYVLMNLRFDSRRAPNLSLSPTHTVNGKAYCTTSENIRHFLLFDYSQNQLSCSVSR